VWYRFAKLIIAGKEHIIKKIADYFSNQGHNTSQLSERLNELDKANKLPIIELRKDGVKFGDNIYTDFLKFAEAVDALHTELIFSKRIKEQKELTKEENDFAPGEIQVFACNSVNDAIRYGAGTSWCISQPGNPYFQSYRDFNQSTFYYVSDGTRQPEDPLSRVMVDMQTNGIVKLTDKNNQTGTIAEFGNDYEAYFDYLRKNGVDTSQFVNKPVTEEERKENELLGERNVTPNWFEDLPPEYKSKYIGRGHLLTNQQLQSIINLPTISGYLIKQYLNTGVSIPPSQKAMLFGEGNQVNQYEKTYKRRRDIAIEEIKKHFGNDDWDLKDYALRSGDYELIDEIINEKGINNFNYVNAPEEMLRYLFSKGLSADRVNWTAISMYQTLSDDFIREFANDVYWKIISDNALESEDYELIDEIINKKGINSFSSIIATEEILRYLLSKGLSTDQVDWFDISQYRKQSEDFIREFKDYVNWQSISYYQKLSEDFIRDFEDNVDWYYISAQQKLSEDFIRDFRDRVNWHWISSKQTLSEDFIREFRDSVDWTGISEKQTLSENFIRDYADRVDWKKISWNSKISDQTKHNLQAAGYPIII